MAMTEAQKRAQEKYRKANKERYDYLRCKGGALKLLEEGAFKDFLTLNDLEELENLITERKKALRSQ